MITNPLHSPPKVFDCRVTVVSHSRLRHLVPAAHYFAERFLLWSRYDLYAAHLHYKVSLKLGMWRGTGGYASCTVYSPPQHPVRRKFMRTSGYRMLDVRYPDRPAPVANSYLEAFLFILAHEVCHATTGRADNWMRPHVENPSSRRMRLLVRDMEDECDAFANACLDRWRQQQPGFDWRALRASCKRTRLQWKLQQLHVKLSDVNADLRAAELRRET